MFSTLRTDSEAGIKCGSQWKNNDISNSSNLQGMSPECTTVLYDISHFWPKSAMFTYIGRPETALSVEITAVTECQTPNCELWTATWPHV